MTEEPYDVLASEVFRLNESERGLMDKLEAIDSRMGELEGELRNISNRIDDLVGEQLRAASELKSAADRLKAVR